MLYNYWQRIWMECNDSQSDDTLYMSDKDKRNITTALHLDRIISIVENSENFPEKQNTFEIFTLEKVYFMAASNEEEKNEWIKRLEEIRRKKTRKPSEY